MRETERNTGRDRGREKQGERERVGENTQKLMDQLSITPALNHGGWRHTLVALDI